MSCQSCGKTNQSLLQKAKNILEGYTNLISKDPEVEKVAAERLKICSTCPLNRPLVCIGDKCTYQCKHRDCKCLTEAKARAINETCPEGKW